MKPDPLVLRVVLNVQFPDSNHKYGNVEQAADDFTRWLRTKNADGIEISGVRMEKFHVLQVTKQEPCFAIHFRRDYNSRNDFTVMHHDIPTLIEASELRSASGDLVVHQETGEVVKDDYWLWPHELIQPDSYARRAIETSLAEKVQLVDDDTRAMRDNERAQCEKFNAAFAAINESTDKQTKFSLIRLLIRQMVDVGVTFRTERQRLQGMANSFADAANLLEQPYNRPNSIIKPFGWKGDYWE